MKRHILVTILGASLLLGAAAQAQTTEVTSTDSAPSASPGAWAGHKHHGGGVLEHLTNALSLTGSQQAAVATIIEQTKPQLKAIHDNAMAQRKTVIDNAASQISPLLTPDQQTKFSDMVQKFESGQGGPRRFAGRRHFDRGGPDSGVLLQRLSAKLSLTTDQQNQIKPILDAAHQQVQTVRNDTSLTPDQRFAKIKDAIQAARSQVNGILTPAQQQQFAAMKDRLHHHGQHQPEAQPSATPATTGSAS